MDREYMPSLIDNGDIVLVKSRELHNRLVEMFPDARETNLVFQEIDININKGLRFKNNFVVSQDVIQNDRHRICMLNVAMRNMWLDMLEDKIKEVPYAIARHCVKHNHVDLLRHLLINNIKISNFEFYKHKEWCDTEKREYMMDEAAEKGLDMLKMLHEHGCTGITSAAMDKAAAYGHFDAMMWLHENRSEGCTTKAMDEAARNGHFDIVKRLHVNRSEVCTTNAIDGAAANGFVNIVRYLFKNRIEGCTDRAMTYAAEYGRLESIRAFIENGVAATADTLDYAAACGRIEIVRYLLSIMIRPTTGAIDRAAANGHTETVHLLLEHKYTLTIQAIKRCMTDKISKLLIESMDREKRKRIAMALMDEDCMGVGFDVLIMSLKQ